MHSWGLENLPHTLHPSDHWASHPNAPSGAGAMPTIPCYLGLGLAGLCWGTAEGRRQGALGDEAQEEGTPCGPSPRCEDERQDPPPGPPGGLGAHEGAMPSPADDPHNPVDPQGDFCWDQREDPTFSRANNQLAAMDGMVTDPQKAAQWPRFELRRDQLYLVERDSQTIEPCAQLVVPWANQRSML